jgi:hypothetical protein
MLADALSNALRIRRFRLAGPAGDGRHAYLGEDGAYLGPGVPLLNRAADGAGCEFFAPRAETVLARILSAAYGKPVDCRALGHRLKRVAAALNRGDRSLAAILLVQAEIEPLPDAAAALRFAKADRDLRARYGTTTRGTVKAGFDPNQPRAPAGEPDGGEWTGGGDSGGASPNVQPAVARGETSNSNAPRSARRVGDSVEYTNPDGSMDIREGGSRAWRNNNPGNVQYDNIAVAHGAIGRDGAFAIFPGPESGSDALDALLHTSKYQDSTLDDAIAKYAPASENNTAAYQAYIRAHLGVPGATLLRDLTPNQMDALQRGIRAYEGSQLGKIRHVPAASI